VSKMKLNAKQIALISVFSALQFVISRLPGIPIMGVTEGKIEPQLILMPAIGMILGPWVGGIAAFIGNFIAWLIPDTTFFGMLMLPTVPIGTIVCGALSRRSSRSDWKVAALILAVLNCLWYLSPPGLLVPYYPFLHLSALALILVFKDRIYDFISGNNKRKFIIGVTIASFSGVMANHMMGNLIFIGAVNWFIQLKGIKDALVSLGFSWLKSGLPKNDPTGLGTIFYIFLPIAVVERIIITAISSLICAGIFHALKRSGIIEI
ncbi:ECF transporter S component, partial [Candidatus Bathyarchaeota archaeon]|nr:ECF transporter S component [Candidatus Bathyarchaeota archaeon]